MLKGRSGRASVPLANPRAAYWEAVLIPVATEGTVLEGQRAELREMSEARVYNTPPSPPPLATQFLYFNSWFESPYSRSRQRT